MLEPGCVAKTRWSAAAGLTEMVPELVPVRPELIKARVMSLATLCERLVKVATPLTAVAVRVPCNVPLPALRAAVSTVLSVTPLAALRTVPN